MTALSWNTLRSLSPSPSYVPCVYNSITSSMLAASGAGACGYPIAGSNSDDSNTAPIHFSTKFIFYPLIELLGDDSNTLDLHATAERQTARPQDASRRQIFAEEHHVDHVHLIPFCHVRK